MRNLYFLSFDEAENNETGRPCSIFIKKSVEKLVKNTSNYPFAEWLFENPYGKIFMNLKF